MSVEERPEDLRRRLRLMHARAGAAIVEGLDLAQWQAQHFDPLVCLRVDAHIAVRRDVRLLNAHVQLRREFFDRESDLLARAEAAARAKRTVKRCKTARSARKSDYI